MPQHLILTLEAPLMSFGGAMIDANGPTLDLPIRSMVTGLIANALGWHRVERNRHQSLQDRLVMGARLDRPGIAVRDFQLVQRRLTNPPSDPAGGLHAQMAVPAEDDVIMNDDAELCRHFDDLKRHLDIGLRRRGIAGRMVMRKDNR